MNKIFKILLFVLVVYFYTNIMFYLGVYKNTMGLLGSGNYGTIYDWYCNMLNNNIEHVYSYNTYEINPSDNNIFRCIYYNETKSNPNKIIYLYNKSNIKVIINE